MLSVSHFKNQDFDCCCRKRHCPDLSRFSHFKSIFAKVHLIEQNNQHISSFFKTCVKNELRNLMHYWGKMAKNEWGNDD